MKIKWRPKPGVVAVVISISDVPIRLTEERWFHIIEYHGELAAFQNEVLLSIALYEVTPYSWDKIAEMLGFNPLILRERLKAFGFPLHKYGEQEMRSEIEAAFFG